jgi:hypothetical protein
VLGDTVDGLDPDRSVFERRIACRD